MRLSYDQVKAILECFNEIFGEGKIYLFGSRVDDISRGGDIDLFLDVENKDDLFEKKIQFIAKLEAEIGEQKIDVVFKKDKSRLIEKEVSKQMVLLNMNNFILEKYFTQCDKHKQRIEEAYSDIHSLLPLNSEKYTNLKKENVQALDQYLFRFAKLQDTLGDKVFKAILTFYENDVTKLTFIDVINKLEKLEYLHSAEQWFNLRKIRNNISHQYDDDPEEMSLAINSIVLQKENLLKVYERIKKVYAEQLIK